VTSDRTFFITIVTAQRHPLFRFEANAKLLLQTLLDYRAQGRYLLHEFVIMPDHLHLLITPAGNMSLERAVQFIKGGFSFRLKTKLTVWQESFTNHRIRDEEDFERYCEYIRMDPIRAGLLGRPEEYPYSSASYPGVDPAPPGLKPSSICVFSRA
jgi:putative transposase